MQHHVSYLQTNATAMLTWKGFKRQFVVIME